MGPTWARRALVGVLSAALLFAVPSGVAVAAQPSPGGDSGQSQSDSGSSGSGSSGSGSSGSAQSDSVEPGASGRRRPRRRRRPTQARAKARAAAAAAAARAERARQQAAAAAQRGRASWESHGRPNQMIIVRRTSVDSLTNGEVTRRTPRVSSAVNLAGLDNAVPSGWITTDGGTLRLAATVVLSPGVTLELGGGGVTNVQLVGGPAAGAAASIYTGTGALNVHNVAVGSVDPASGQPVAAGPGRPFVYVSGGGRMDATDATFSDLGTPDSDPNGQPGVAFGIGSTGSLVRTTMLRNSVGARLSGSNGVRLEGLTVSESAAEGLILQGDQGTTLSGVRAERNGDNGVQVSGPSSARPITGITTSGNAKFGVAVVSQDAPQISGIVTQADGFGGLQLSGDTNPVVTDFSAVDQPIGVFTHVSSTNVNLSGLRISGGGRGVMIEKTTEGVTLSGSTIERAQTGISLGGKNVDLRDVLISGSQSGLRVERGATGVTATALNVTGGQDGVVVIPGTDAVLLRDLTIDGTSGNGVRTSGTNAQIQGGRISNTPTGIDAEAATTINGTEITGVNVGIRARATDLVAADDVTVSAMSSGVTVQEGSPFVLTDSRVDALQAVTGEANYQGLNTLSLPPLNVLGVIGIPLVLLALLLDQVQRFRQRNRPSGDQRRLPPPRLQVGTH